ncbi:cytochrome c [Chachezhania antarctica]|uniref:cytochrome c n=1 Tax=Chachezhania antarctica TaxID=2340860 RepID=UPI000EB58E58|nr:cytochrome c [Chachezhania antarctica]|tara:strand:- start:3160 stop:3645 length:486 start_codon:yes stop_codon:yes gene_type:complete
MIDRMKWHTNRRTWPIPVAIFLGLAVLVACGVEPDPTDLLIDDRRVQDRVTGMVEAQTSLHVLTDMLSARVRFNKSNARTARKVLIRTMSHIPRDFRKERDDPLSRTSPHVWAQWDDFRRKADIAEDRAKDMDVRSWIRLRDTIAPLITACQTCHDSYRTW